jgi:hypothetical protein
MSPTNAHHSLLTIRLLDLTRDELIAQLAAWDQPALPAAAVALQAGRPRSAEMTNLPPPCVWPAKARSSLLTGDRTARDGQTTKALFACTTAS